MTAVNPAPTLSDGTVTLRAHQTDDLQGVWEQCQDPESQRWTTVPVPYHRTDEEFIRDVIPAGWADGSSWTFAVEVEGRFAGTVDLRDLGTGRADLGFGSHPWVRGQGVMRAAVRLLIEWGFAEQGLRAISWRAFTGNWASRRLAWRLGFRIEGTVRQLLPHRGELRDAWVGTLLMDDPREPRGRWLPTPSLTTPDGLRLRPWRESDVARIVEACSDGRTQHWLGQMPRPYAATDARSWMETHLEGAATGTKVTWAVCDADDVPLGAINVFDINEYDAEIGYWTHPEARGRGVMTAAMRGVTGWCFAELGVGRLRAVAALENIASRHVIESVGYRETGIERLGTVLRTGRVDVALYDVLASEWIEVSADE